MGPPAPSGIGATGGIIAFPYTEKGIPWKKEENKCYAHSIHCFFQYIQQPSNSYLKLPHFGKVWVYLGNLKIIFHYYFFLY